MHFDCEAASKTTHFNSVGPQVVVLKNVGPQVVVRQNVGPQVVVRQNVGPQVLVRQNVGPQVVVQKNVGPQVVVRQNVGPQVVVRQNVGPQVVVRQNVGPQVVVRQNVGPQNSVFLGSLDSSRRAARFDYKLVIYCNPVVDVPETVAEQPLFLKLTGGCRQWQRWANWKAATEWRRKVDRQEEERKGEVSLNESTIDMLIDPYQEGKGTFQVRAQLYVVTLIEIDIY
ncbi:hypothetical protein M5K25_018605 [Dendrobium thyrsiflorum]|uniref:Uncharacterized protein n=1 Tax=Dendrobium thyrsiflorum TaxID=117978 RepID=A0ABD0UQK6_DENTH